MRDTEPLTGTCDGCGDGQVRLRRVRGFGLMACPACMAVVSAMIPVMGEVRAACMEAARGAPGTAGPGG